jgi:hypothetical protein
MALGGKSECGFLLLRKLTLISLKMQTPQKREAIPPGTVLMMGKATGSDSALFATNQHPVATAHIKPDTIPATTRKYFFTHSYIVLSHFLGFTHTCITFCLKKKKSESKKRTRWADALAVTHPAKQHTVRVYIV